MKKYIFKGSIAFLALLLYVNTAFAETESNVFENFEALPLNVLFETDGGDIKLITDENENNTLYKTVFKLIFEALEKEQHYKMMMGEETQ